MCVCARICFSLALSAVKPASYPPPACAFYPLRCRISVYTMLRVERFVLADFPRPVWRATLTRRDHVAHDSFHSLVISFPLLYYTLQIIIPYLYTNYERENVRESFFAFFCSPFMSGGIIFICFCRIDSRESKNWSRWSEDHKTSKQVSGIKWSHSEERWRMSGEKNWAIFNLRSSGG